MLIGILGVLKAGGAYVPIDPLYPSERSKFILEHAQPKVVLTSQKSLKLFSWLNDFLVNIAQYTFKSINMIVWEDVSLMINKYSSNNLINITSSKSRAYLIYTSGSTGNVKGVCGTHFGTVNRLDWSWKSFPFKSDESCYQKTSLNFVDHVAELFSPLLKGFTLVLLSNSAINEVNVAKVISDIIVHNISRIVLVPSLLDAILHQKKSKLLKFRSLKYIFSSGEALTKTLANKFHELLPWVKLINVYGSSEVSADVTYYTITVHETNITSYFNEGIKTLETKLQLAKSGLITTPSIELDDLKEQFKCTKIPIDSRDYQEYYQYLQENVLPYIVNTASPRFIGHMTSVLPGFIHEFSKLVSVLNQNLVKIETSKSLTFIERQVIAMLHRSFYKQSDDFYTEHTQNPMSVLGIITSSGTVANITALWAARNNNFLSDGVFKGISEEGFNAALNYYGYQDSIILVSPLLHYSFEKAASLLGIGKKHIHYLPLTSEYVVDIQALQEYINKCNKEKKYIIALVGIAGATETGSIDPLINMAEVAKKFKIHFHVDASFGGPLIFSDKYGDLLNGIEYADSITLCGHKQLYLPMGISMCFFRDPQKAQLICNTADYQATMQSFDFGKYSLEGSRSAISLLLHSALHLIGKKGYEQLIAIGMENTNYLRLCILKNDSFELINEPTINIINYRYVPKKFRKQIKMQCISEEENKLIDNANILLQTQQFKHGKTFVSKTFIYSNKYHTEILTLRAVLSNPLITSKDIDQVLNDQIQISLKYIENNEIVCNTSIKDVEDISDDKSFGELTLPIGKPITNTQIYVLDQYLVPKPVGAIGELHVSGNNLVEGYFNRPELTAEKFIANPFQTKEERDDKKYGKAGRN
ncbi:MAG: aminotransferase class V-fold PLP-dependent enzyme, partial [Alphaproteobacteria bacterium]|nr:aminotransferase class V-fold PLP-dependent enzyme [Alphaproteobacteria bacterium]